MEIKKFTLNENESNNKRVFLGGTCAESKWREELIEKLKIDYFNPVVEDWTTEAQEEEIRERRECDYCLYVITPRMKGIYSIAEVVDDSNKRPEKTLFCYLEEDESYEEEDSAKLTFSKEQLKSLKQVAKMIKINGGKTCKSLDAVAKFLNKRK